MAPPIPKPHGEPTKEEMLALKTLSQEFKNNQTDVAVFDLPICVDFWMAAQEDQGVSKPAAMEKLKTLFSNASLQELWVKVEWYLTQVKSWTPTILDGKALGELAYDMSRNGSILSKYVIKEMGGKQYIIFKGYAGLRRLITGTRYLADNTKLASIGIGKMGALKSVKGGMVLSLFLCVGFRALEQLLNDQATWHDFVGGLAADLTKVAIAGAAGMIAACLVGGAATVGTIAVGPLFAAVAVGVVVGLALDALDDKIGFTRALIVGLREAEKNVAQDIQQLQKEYRWYTRDPISEANFWMRVFGGGYY